MNEAVFLELAQDLGYDKLPEKIELKGFQIEHKSRGFLQKEEPPSMDRFGFPSNGEKAKVNAVLDRIPRTWKRILLKSKAQNVRILPHLRTLIRRGYVVKKGEKFRLHKKYW